MQLGRPCILGVGGERPLGSVNPSVGIIALDLEKGQLEGEGDFIKREWSASQSCFHSNSKSLCGMLSMSSSVATLEPVGPYAFGTFYMRSNEPVITDNRTNGISVFAGYEQV